VNSISGTEGGRTLPDNLNKSTVITRLNLTWTTLVLKAEFDTIVEVPKNITLLSNGTYTEYSSVFFYKNISNSSASLGEDNKMKCDFRISKTSAKNYTLFG